LLTPASAAALARSCLRPGGRVGKGFSDHVVTFLLQRFESKEEKVRIGTLNIFKHIINTSGAPAWHPYGPWR